MGIHLPDKFLLSLRAQIAMYGGLDFVKLLDDILQVVFASSVLFRIPDRLEGLLSTVLNVIWSMLVVGG